MARAADIGSSFGDSLTVLTSARQAGSGGIALEDPWRQGSLAEATTVVQDVGPRWLGFSVQGGAGHTLRIGADGFYYSPGQITQTTETAAGTYGGRGGDLKVVEWGARFLAQFSVLDAAGWRVAALGRTTGMMQQLPDVKNVGVAAEAGAQAQHWMEGGLTLTGWLWIGPLGEGASHGFAGQETIGVGLLKPVTHGLLGGAEGYGVGLEGDWLNAGLLHGSLGATYWVGKASEPGVTCYLRAGVKSASQTAQTVQPRGGIGVLWRSAAGMGLQFDYAVVPIGELGWYHYVTLGVRLPSARSSPPPPTPTQESEALPIAPEEPPQAVVVRPVPAPARETIVFFPQEGEMARVTVEVKTASPFGASILDGEGRFLRVLIEAKDVPPGKQEVIWDGNLEAGEPAHFDLPYTIQVSHDHETEFFKVVAKKVR